MKCTVCNEEITKHQYAAVFASFGIGFRVEVGCEHRPIKFIDRACAVADSEECLLDWIQNWTHSLKLGGAN